MSEPEDLLEGAGTVLTQKPNCVVPSILAFAPQAQPQPLPQA